ncbi:MAG: undecaprenyl-diphosphate phosphatase [Pseudomonadota bacterium]
MSFFQLFILSVVQGVTEWLPISSSGHVLLIAAMYGIVGNDEVLINAMAHVGTLFSILLYFRRDILDAIGGGFELIRFGADRSSGPLSRHAKLALHIILATPVAVAAGLGFALLSEGASQALRSLWVVIGTTLFFAVLLWWADVKGSSKKGAADMTSRDAFLIGATQAIAALLPGTSRSGITMTAARALGFSRIEAARFSMLIGVPLIIAGGAYAFLELATADAGSISLTLNDGLIVLGLSFLAGYVSIAGLMALLVRMSFLPFVIYRLCLGLALILASPIGFALIPA